MADMKETHKRRITVTSSLNQISTDQLGNGGGGGVLRPTPFYSRLLDWYFKTSWTVFLHPHIFFSWCPSMKFSASNEFLLFFKAYLGRWLSSWKKIRLVRLGSFYRRKSFQAYAHCSMYANRLVLSVIKSKVQANLCPETGTMFFVFCRL
jgi:hypothetical protein